MFTWPPLMVTDTLFLFPDEGAAAAATATVRGNTTMWKKAGSDKFVCC